jgi:uncharacterized protein (TIGR02118 family)
VIYPRPTDIEAFEKMYQDEHVPMAVEKLGGKTKFVATKVLACPQGIPPFYRIAGIHFLSMEALEACAASAGLRRHWPMPCLSPPEEDRSFWSLRNRLSLSSIR